MGDRSEIEWTDATWNPVRGCKKISPGCKHCYAKTFAERFRGVPGHPYEQGFDPRLVPSKLADPLRWAHSRRIFVNSMSDLFQEAVPEQFITQVFEVMAAADWHTFQLLTKRADRMRRVVEQLPLRLRSLPNVWLGVSVEDRRYGVPRIDDLRQTPASVRFLSIEPLIEDIGKIDLREIHWVIVGGESGLGARPMQESWVLSVKQQCNTFDVPFFFKQWGGVRKHLTGRKLRGEEYNDAPPIRAARPPVPSVRRERLKTIQQHLHLPIVKAA